MLKKIIQRLKEAGAKSESSFDRDGAFSYHAETHAAGMGLAAGYVATAHGETKLLGVALGAAVHGRAAERNGKRRRILMDIVDEWHYALGGIVVGGVIGAGVRAITGVLPI